MLRSRFRIAVLVLLSSCGGRDPLVGPIEPDPGAPGSDGATTPPTNPPTSPDARPPTTPPGVPRDAGADAAPFPAPGDAAAGDPAAAAGDAAALDVPVPQVRRRADGALHADGHLHEPG
jgi:hypothetical protein